MAVARREELGIRTDGDVVRVRQVVRAAAIEVGFNIVDQTKIITAASELARNTLQHGGGGTAVIEIVDEGLRRGVRIRFADEGPGIADIEQALTDGFTTGGGMGLGLGGAKRLSNEFAIETTPGRGTRVTIARWR